MENFSVEKRIKELNEVVSVCNKVKTTLETDGWKDIIEPLIDKTITDITGCKMPNGRWHGGLLDRAKKDEKREFYIGYKQALIDFHRRIWAYTDSIKRIEEERGQLVSGSKKAYTTPMIDDVRGYGYKD
jgi:hypothetical protein